MFHVVDTLDDPVMHDFLSWIRLVNFPGDAVAMIDYI